MKKNSHFKAISLCLSFLLIGSSQLLNAQTVRVPGGAAGIGNSNNGNVGIGVNSPSAKLDIATDELAGALQLSTTVGGNGMSSNPPGVGISPYAIKVLHTSYDAMSQTFLTNPTFLLSATGRLDLGNIAAFNPTRMLNLPGTGLGVYKSANTAITLTYGNTPGLPGPALNCTGTENFALTYGNVKALQVTPNQKVLIGTDLAPGDYKLYIGGKAIAEEVVVKLQANWPDYVFAPNYTMLTNVQLRQYITENGKLPYLPSAAQVAENGLPLGETQTQLTRLVEELTLRLLEMEERVQELESQLAKQ
jgi:hypothetical protein